MVEISSSNLIQQYVLSVNRQQNIPQNPNLKHDLPYDTVEISKKNSPAVSNFAKIAIGFAAIATAVATAITLKTRMTPSKLQKVFNEIYMRRDITIEEAQRIAKKYKELEKIEDKEEFVKSAFEEIKKNFGFKDKPIKLTINAGDKKGWSGCYIDNSKINIDIDEKSNNLRLLSLLHHEFRHAKQHEIMFNQYPKFAKEKMLNALKKIKGISTEIDDYFRKLVTEGMENPDEIIEKTVEKFNTQITQRIEKYFGQLSPDNVAEKYKDFAKKCMENQKKYISSDTDKKAYRNQFVEKDAYKIQSKIYNLMDCYKE